MQHYRFAGHRVIEFPRESKEALKELSARLTPFEETVVDSWIAMQFNAWQPPGLDRDQLKSLFGGILRSIFGCMASGELEQCINGLEESGAALAQMNFPYEALVVSLHFLEESYMPFLLTPRSERTQDWLIHMDEFLHVGLAALATSYFDFHRSQLLADAEIGRIVQEALFPHPPKQLFDLELGFIYQTAHERARLGGDFLDVFTLADGTPTFLLGDMSGHGLQAASNSTTIRNIFRGLMRERPDLADAIARLNRILTQELSPNQFATALACIYPEPGKLVIVNAGQCLPIICDESACFIEQTGMPLSVMDDTLYTRIEIDMKPGSVFVAYTDGVTEARAGNDMFGEDRLLQAVNGMRDAPARAIAEELKYQAARHAHGQLLDDIAILVLKRGGEVVSC